jgi:hypothetical protein
MGTRFLSSPLARAYFAGANSLIGAAVNAIRCAPTTLGGFYAAPFHVPQDLDPAKAAFVYIVVAPTGNSLINGQVVQLQLATTVIDPPVTTDLSVLTLNWAVPNNWLTSQPQSIFLDNGTGVTFNPGELPQETTIGMRISRNGPAAADTFAQSLEIAALLILNYKTKFPWLPVQI